MILRSSLKNESSLYTSVSFSSSSFSATRMFSTSVSCWERYRNVTLGRLQGTSLESTNPCHLLCSQASVLVQLISSDKPGSVNYPTTVASLFIITSRPAFFVSPSSAIVSAIFWHYGNTKGGPLQKYGSSWSNFYDSTFWAIQLISPII